jgi:hypothetical protein
MFWRFGGAMTNYANYGGIVSHLMRLRAVLEPEFTVLRNSAVRPLPVVLARRLVNARADDPYLETFHRLYESLAASDRTRCLTEMAQQSRLASAHSPSSVTLS